MRILHVDSNHPVLHETLTGAGFDCDLFWDKPADELQRLLPEYDAVVIRSRFRLTRALLEECTRLKCIGRVGAGMENIDVAFAERKVSHISRSWTSSLPSRLPAAVSTMQPPIVTRESATSVNLLRPNRRASSSSSSCNTGRSSA